MSGLAPPRPLPLPRGWARQARLGAIRAISLADLALTRTLSWAADSLNPRLRLQAELEQLRREISLLREEIRIKDAPMEEVEPHRRRYYPPSSRLAILELRASRGRSLAQTPRTFLVSSLTIASWTRRLEEEGPDALVLLPVPVNKFPEFVSCVVQRLRTLCAGRGKAKIAQVLARAGLILGPTTVRRMQRIAAAAETSAGFLHGSSRRYGPPPQSPLACGPDDRAYRSGLLDPVYWSTDFMGSDLRPLPRPYQ